MLTRRATAAVVFAVAMAAGAAACGSSSSGGKNAAGQTGPSTRPGPSACPTPPANSQKFPAGASSDLPRPNFAASPEAVPVGGVQGVTLLRFTTAMPLRDAAAFLLKRYPEAGYRLVQGDSEGDEADAPFIKGQLHGKTRLTGTGPCSTTWLVAVTTGKASLTKLPGLHSHHDD